MVYYIYSIALIFITAFNLINLVLSFLLQQPGVDYLLSAKLNQDPLKEFFGKQRAIGRRADNPTA